jgi:methylglutaconyl-CoA hydratase
MSVDRSSPERDSETPSLEPGGLTIDRSSAVRMDTDANGVVTATLNRADQNNCLDDEVLRALDAILQQCEADKNVRVLRLAAGGKHFCAGADIRQFSVAAEPKSVSPSLGGVLLRLKLLPLPTIALIQGACIGGGLGLAACCDVVVAEDRAFFAATEVRLGVAPAVIIPFLISALGERQARRFVLSGERVDAREGHRCGLVSEIGGRDELDGLAAHAVSAFLRGAPRALAETKRQLADTPSAALTMENLSRLEKRTIERFTSTEAMEGIAAFLEKRPPIWLSPNRQARAS